MKMKTFNEILNENANESQTWKIGNSAYCNGMLKQDSEFLLIDEEGKTLTFMSEDEITMALTDAEVDEDGEEFTNAILNLSVGETYNYDEYVTCIRIRK